MNDKTGFGNRIKTIREFRGYTIEQCAELVEVSVSAWRLYEKGQRLPSITVLIKMCLVLGKTADYFLGPELDDLLDDMQDSEKLKNKIDRLLPNEIQVIDAAVSKHLEISGK